MVSVLHHYQNQILMECYGNQREHTPTASPGFGARLRLSQPPGQAQAVSKPSPRLSFWRLGLARLCRLQGLRLSLVHHYRQIAICLNLELDLRFGSGWRPNLELNLGSEPNLAITTLSDILLSNNLILTIEILAKLLMLIK
jgi:hypothetical protein